MALKVRFEKGTAFPGIFVPDLEIPPNQIEFPGWSWAYNPVSEPKDFRLSVSYAPTDVDLTFGWEKDPFSTDNSIDLHFEPGAPTVAFWIGVILGENAPDKGTVTLAVQEL